MRNAIYWQRYRAVGEGGRWDEADDERAGEVFKGKGVRAKCGEVENNEIQEKRWEKEDGVLVERGKDRRDKGILVFGVCISKK